MRAAGPAALVAAALAACAPRGSPERAGQFFSRLPLGVPSAMPVPRDYPLTAERVALGRRLFFDKQLSRDGSLACASCHRPELAFTDGRATTVGVSGTVGRRNAPTIINRAYGESMFWDGRVRTLEEQALLPMTSPLELGNTHEEIERRLNASASYRRAFARAFGSDEITIARTAAAIASFERTLVSGDTPVDRYRTSGAPAELTALEREGLALFTGRARCVVCHDRENFTDERFHNTGVAWRDGILADSGRYAVTGRAEDLGAFKTPTLREVARTAPYMHDGSLATLADVIEFYDRGGRSNPHLDGLIQPLDLTASERRALLAFLHSLTSPLPHK